MDHSNPYNYLSAIRATIRSPFFIKSSLMQIIVFICLLLIEGVVAYADVYFDTSLFAYSEPVTIKGAMTGWEGPFSGGRAALTHNWIETGVAYQKWKFGFIKRFDYELGFSQDTADFLYRIENKQPLQAGKTYQLDLTARHTYSEGLRLSQEFEPAAGLNLVLGVAYLRGLRLTEGTFKGSATALSESDYDFQFDVDYFYSKDALFDREVQPPDGEGYSIDLSLAWQPVADFGAVLQIKDLYGLIYWENAPRTTATALSDVKEYDENGYVIYRPVLSGRESNENYTQKLPRKIAMQADYRILAKTHLVGRIYYTKVVTLTQGGVEYSLTDSSRLQLLYMFETSAVTLGYKKKDVYLALTSDSTEFNTAHTFGLNMYFLITF